MTTIYRTFASKGSSSKLTRKWQPFIQPQLWSEETSKLTRKWQPFIQQWLQRRLSSKLTWKRQPFAQQLLQRRGNTPFRRPSCQAREEKRKFSPTATSLRRRRQRSRTWATAQRALAEERKWRPKVHQARWDDRFSSRFLSLLLTAAIVPTRPTPLLLCSLLPLSLSLRPGLMHSKMWLCELYIICYQF